MKAEVTLPAELVDEIANRVIEKLKPFLYGYGSRELKEDIFTPETLAKYLSVDTSWVYKAVSNKLIPYFKNGKYIRFKRFSIDKWIASKEREPILNFKQLKNSRLSS